jgi:hypothetical protein
MKRQKKYSVYGLVTVTYLLGFGLWCDHVNAKLEGGEDELRYWGPCIGFALICAIAGDVEQAVYEDSLSCSKFGSNATIGFYYPVDDNLQPGPAIGGRIYWRHLKYSGPLIMGVEWYLCELGGPSCVEREYIKKTDTFLGSFDLSLGVELKKNIYIYGGAGWFSADSDRTSGDHFGDGSAYRMLLRWEPRARKCNEAKWLAELRYEWMNLDETTSLFNIKNVDFSGFSLSFGFSF